MRKGYLILIGLLWSMACTAQTCDCSTHFNWVKKTFEENDAGAIDVLTVKGAAAYAAHNEAIASSVAQAQTLEECTMILREWLRFFRSGHLTITLNETSKATDSAHVRRTEWGTYAMKPEAFQKYLDKKRVDDYEGIWGMGSMQIGIKKEADQYIGFVIDAGTSAWEKATVLLQFNVSDSRQHVALYQEDHTRRESDTVQLIGKNYLRLGNLILARKYPVLEDDLRYARYVRSLQAQHPYIEEWVPSTLYLRIPTFDGRQKRVIDSLLLAYRDKLLRTEHLIIDIRNNRGGNDASYSEILPYLYTNPIRSVGVRYYSTKLNNQRMIDFVHDTVYGLSDEVKAWAQESYGVLSGRIGEFVNLRPNTVTELTLDTVYAFPKNVGILIDRRNVSTAEQFLLAAKQSKKVKLFGVTTGGALDYSNMYFVDAPCREFQLGYCLTRSMRLPEFPIDDIGIQPDYFLDGSIPPHDWAEYVHRVLSDR